MDPASIVSAVAAVIAAVAAVASWRAAVASNRSSKQLAEIEVDRRHSELTPQLLATLERVGAQTYLRVRFDGPPSLDRLDRITIRVLDDDIDHTTIDRDHDPSTQIWGPLRFVPGIDGASSDGRIVGPFALARRSSRVFAVEPTRAPVWADDSNGWWRRTYQSEDSVFRTEAHCESAGYSPWVLVSHTVGQPAESLPG